MRRPPAFWSRGGGEALPLLLSPLAALTAMATARRVARPGWRSPVPVVCCGNVTVGGAGKTTVALDIGRRLVAHGLNAHFLLRGYGGSAQGTRLVRPDDQAAVTGDEALLLAGAAPTWTGADRAASARAAIAQGARILVMDDGLQNPTLCKDLSLLVVDGGFGFGNGRVMPAGPLRETVQAGAARCQAAVLIGDDAADAAASLPADLPLLRAHLVPGLEASAFVGRRVFAFAGIAVPEKFFSTLASLDVVFAGRASFPDHHPYSERELQTILAEAVRLRALPVTTAKDAVRIPAEWRNHFQILGITLAWQSEEQIETLLTNLIGGGEFSGRDESHR